MLKLLKALPLVFTISISIYLFAFITNLTQGNDLTFVIYGTEYCDTCTELKEFLHREVRGARIVFLDLIDKNNSARFMEVVNLLYEIGALPQTPCPTCKPPMERLRVLIPLTGILKGGELKAIIIGFYNQTLWKETLSLVIKSNTTYFITPLGIRITINDHQVKEKLESLIIGSS